MFRLSLGDCLDCLVDPVNAELLGDVVDVTGVSIDTRTLRPGDLYIAINGDQFDGHDFIDNALRAGAAAIVASRRVDTRLPTIMVSDTRKALSALAGYWARRHQVPTIAITGSNGKTTCKEIIATILSELGPVLATRGNLNNDIGVPLTLLGLRSKHRYAVIEMGANAPGEIRALSKLVQPDVALVNNVGAAHLEGFGTVDDVATAKAEIFEGLSADGWAVINAEDAYAPVMRKAAAHCRRREFGLGEHTDVQGVAGAGLQIRTLGQRLAPRFQLMGNHNGLNALAAVAAVQCLDVQPVSIVKGLEKVQAVPGRMERKAGLRGSTLIDDSYNGNPVSVQRAIDVLAELPGQRHLVLGDMGELGTSAIALHAEVGAYARQKGIHVLWTVGELTAHASLAFDSNSHPVQKASAKADAAANPEEVAGGHFVDQKSLIAAIAPTLGRDCTVLVKGSRSAKMDLVVKALQASFPPPGNAASLASGPARSTLRVVS